LEIVSDKQKGQLSKAVPAVQSSRRFHLPAVIFNMGLGCFRSVVDGMLVVPVSEVCVVSCRLVFSRFVVLGGFLVVSCCVFVMLRCFVMVLDCLL
jgi:hypothetical protein